MKTTVIITDRASISEADYRGALHRMCDGRFDNVAVHTAPDSNSIDHVLEYAIYKIAQELFLTSDRTSDELWDGIKNRLLVHLRAAMPELREYYGC